MNHNNERICQDLEVSVISAIKKGVALDYVKSLKNKDIIELTIEQENVDALIIKGQRQKISKESLLELNARRDLCRAAGALQRKVSAFLNSCAINDSHANLAGYAWANALRQAEKLKINNSTISQQLILKEKYNSR